MAAKIKLSVWRRKLRRGDEGDDVRWLQSKLASFGYEVGEIDGRFGYLTEDALIEFQRDHRLRVDRIAGPRVIAALLEDVPRKRVVHEVRSGERLSDLAKVYGTSVDAIRWMNHLRSRSRLVPGKRLVIRSSHILVGLPHAANTVVQRTLATERKSISSLAVYGLSVETDGTLQGEVDGVASALTKEERWVLTAAVRHEDAGEAGDLIGSLSKRKLRRRLFASLRERLDRREFEALLLDIGHVPPGRGSGVTAGLVALKKAFPRLPILVALAPPEQGWRGLLSDLDYRRVGECVDRFLLALHRWECFLGNQGETPHRDRVERWVAQTTRLIPPWKVLLGTPMGACRLTEIPQEVGYRAAVAVGLSHRRRPRADENGFLCFRIDEGEDQGTYILVGREGFSRLITLAYRYRLAGVFLHPAGLEDRRLWDVVSRRLWAEQL